MNLSGVRQKITTLTIFAASPSEGVGDYRRALIDYANAIELFNTDKKKISSGIFMRMANGLCEAWAVLRGDHACS